MTDPKQRFREILVEWLKELVPYGDFDKYVRKVRETYNVNTDERHANSVTYIFCTDTHTFNVYAHADYIGAGASSRKVRAGEDWTRGNDLPDGPFVYDTWKRIKDAIIRYEMVKLDIRPSAPVPDTPPRTPSRRLGCDSSTNPNCHCTCLHVTHPVKVHNEGCPERPSCGNTLCHVEHTPMESLTRHDTRCPEYGPGWA